MDIIFSYACDIKKAMDCSSIQTSIAKAVCYTSSLVSGRICSFINRGYNIARIHSFRLFIFISLKFLIECVIMR